MKNMKNEGSVRPAFALAVLLMVVFTVGGYALNYVKYSESSYWTDADGIVASDVTVGDDLAVTDDAEITGILKALPTSVASTANASITVGAASTILLSAAAQGNATVTNTIAAPTVAGTWAVLINNGVSNSIEITEGTTLDSGGTKTLGPEDVMLLFGADTNAWKAIYHDN